MVTPPHKISSLVTPPHLIANVWICRDSIAGLHHEPLIINVPEALFEKQSDDSIRTTLLKTLVAVLNFATACILPKNQQNVYNTMYSQAVTHPSTNMAQCCLTSVIRRELVFST